MLAYGLNHGRLCDLCRDLYTAIWGRVRKVPGADGGVDFREARRWHQRIYGGLVSVTSKAYISARC